MFARKGGEESQGKTISSFHLPGPLMKYQVVFVMDIYFSPALTIYGKNVIWMSLL